MWRDPSGPAHPGATSGEARPGPQDDTVGAAWHQSEDERALGHFRRRLCTQPVTLREAPPGSPAPRRQRGADRRVSPRTPEMWRDPSGPADPGATSGEARPVPQDDTVGRRAWHQFKANAHSPISTAPRPTCHAEGGAARFPAPRRQRGADRRVLPRTSAMWRDPSGPAHPGTTSGEARPGPQDDTAGRRAPHPIRGEPGTRRRHIRRSSTQVDFVWSSRRIHSRRCRYAKYTIRAAMAHSHAACMGGNQWRRPCFMAPV
jgi:hypothetical protein